MAVWVYDPQVSNPRVWYACIEDYERAAINLIVDAWLLAAVDVPRTVYDGAWVAYGGTVGDHRYYNWLRVMGSEIVTYVIDDVEVEFVTIWQPFATNLNLYLGDPSTNKTYCVALLYPDSPTSG